MPPSRSPSTPRTTLPAPPNFPHFAFAPAAAAKTARPESSRSHASAPAQTPPSFPPHPGFPAPQTPPAPPQNSKTHPPPATIPNLETPRYEISAPYIFSVRINYARMVGDKGFEPLTSRV